MVHKRKYGVSLPFGKIEWFSSMSDRNKASKLLKQAGISHLRSSEDE